MNKKIVIGCIGIVFMLVAITMVSTVSSKTTEKKESPLYRLRIQKAVETKIIKNRVNLKDIVSNFLINNGKQRIYLRNIADIAQNGLLNTVHATKSCYTCHCTVPVNECHTILVDTCGLFCK